MQFQLEIIASLWTSVDLRKNISGALTLLVGWQKRHPTCENVLRLFPKIVSSDSFSALKHVVNHLAREKLVHICFIELAFSALMLLVGRQEGHPAHKKTEWWGAGVVLCLDRGADLHTAQLVPLPLTVSCFSKIQIGFTFLVLAHPGSPGQRAVKRARVCELAEPRITWETRLWSVT